MTSQPVASDKIELTEEVRKELSAVYSDADIERYLAARKAAGIGTKKMGAGLAFGLGWDAGVDFERNRVKGERGDVLALADVLHTVITDPAYSGLKLSTMLRVTETLERIAKRIEVQP